MAKSKSYWHTLAVLIFPGAVLSGGFYALAMLWRRHVSRKPAEPYGTNIHVTLTQAMPWLALVCWLVLLLWVATLLLKRTFN